MYLFVSLLLVTSFTYWILHTVSRFFSQTNLSYIPVIRKSWRFPFGKSESISCLLERGYESVIKGQGLPFRIRYWNQEYVVLPIKYLKDLKHARKDHLSFTKSIEDVFFLKFWTEGLFDTDRMVYTIKKGLNPHLNEATDLCIDEVTAAIQEELGTSFTSFPALELCSLIAHRVASKIIVGDELCRNRAFEKASYDYFRGHAMTGFFLLMIPSDRLRNILARPLSYFQHARQKRVLSMVSAAMKHRLDAKTSDGKHVEQIDCIEWSLRIKDDFPVSRNKDLLGQMSHELIHLLGASHAPTGMIITQILWQLLDRPEYLEPLRKEAEEAVSRFGFTSKIVEHLPLQDSFIGEINRLYSNNKRAVGCQRMILDDQFTFHDGFTLPAGTRIAFPVDQTLTDPDRFENPDTFDGFRLLRLKEADARTECGVNIWKASHPHQRNLAFGYGNHVCPGRFFAVRLIKIIFTKLLLEYDFRSEWTEKGIPPGFQIEGSMIPHMSARISFKRIVTG